MPRAQATHAALAAAAVPPPAPVAQGRAPVVAAPVVPPPAPSPSVAASILAPLPAQARPVAVAGAYLPPSATFGDAPAAAPSRPSPEPRAPAASSPIRAFADLRLETPADLPAWFVAAGAVAAIVGFVMPWSSNGMVGGGPAPDFFSRWGLANAANAILVVLAFGALYLQLGTDNPRTIVRTGAVGLLLGGVLAGFAFVYATSAFGLATGGTLVAMGAVALVVGGLLAIVPRHRPEEPPV
ncbi:MAG TPA: hypothetical protein VGK63_02445 [Candidatus Limnocylindrales bacterium]